MTTPMTDEQRRIKSYLTAQAAKLEPAAIVAKVRDAMAELEAAAVALPPSRFTERPAPDEWSGDEVMAHVAASDAYFGGGIVSILDDRPLPARGEDGGSARTRGAPGGGVVPGARAGSRGALRARARGVRRTAGPTARSSTACSGRSPGARRCSSCACTTSIMPASSGRSPPRCRRRRGTHCRRRNLCETIALAMSACAKRPGRPIRVTRSKVTDDLERDRRALQAGPRAARPRRSSAAGLPTAIAPREGVPAGRRARSVLATTSAIHFVHDGFSDVIYLLLPVWATPVRPDLRPGGPAPNGVQRGHGRLSDPCGDPRRALGRDAAPRRGHRGHRPRLPRRRAHGRLRGAARLPGAGRARLRRPAPAVLVARVEGLRDRAAADGARHLQLRGRPRQGRRPRGGGVHHALGRLARRRRGLCRGRPPRGGIAPDGLDASRRRPRRARCSLRPPSPEASRAGASSTRARTWRCPPSTSSTTRRDRPFSRSCPSCSSPRARRFARWGWR